ncbi:von Willebrand factor D and EGF domain-containing protein-like [Argopecten irradians]|uniref:von Willebrand factor D and EGF domain-containing protein-like n=1 Tax=Argopecten irradians TaxID=31199 RepID=UPI0037150B98
MIRIEVWSYLILFVLTVSSTGSDPCDDANHAILGDTWRSTSYETPAGGTKHCDAAIEEQWYKPEGADMPTSAPDLNKCGTTSPIWMDDSLPTSTSITEVKVCLKSLFSACQFTWNIRVKKCNTFYVYELKQANLCNAAYCFGDRIKCPAGQNSDTGYQPGCGEYPNITLTAEVTHGLVEAPSEFAGTPTILKGIVFQCDISSDDDLTAYVYDIQWFINDNSIVTHRNIPYTNLTQTGLHQSEWTGTYKLGCLVKCAVRVRNDTDNPPTQITNSEYFHAGIETDSLEYEVPENAHINILVRLTVPIDCMYLPTFTPEEIHSYTGQFCKVSIRLSVPKESDVSCTLGGVTNDPVSFDNTQCGIQFNFDEWNISKNLTVYGSTDGIVKMSVSTTAFLRLEADASFASVAWSHATKPDIKIHVLDEDIILRGKSCTIQTDPHINTFDGRHVRFLLEGEYIIYQHETIPIRIHAVFDTCWQAARGSCTCGVAIRYIDAVFVLNFCKEKIGEEWLPTSNVNKYVEMRACEDSSMTVQYTSGIYTVTLPSGTVIKMRLHLGALNTHIFVFELMPSLSDWRATSGMCGFLDGVKDNDIRDRDGKKVRGFGNIWLLNSTLDGPSLFTSNPELVDLPRPSLQYCQCPVRGDDRPSLISQTHCNLTSPSESCEWLSDFSSYVTQCDKYRENVREKRDTSGYLHRHPRSTDEDIEVPRFDLKLDETYANSPDENITWINGWNESLAEEVCRNTMDSDPMLIKCKDFVFVMNDITENGIQECMDDIMISGHAGFLEDTKKALQTTCQGEAERFENLTTHANGTSASFLEELLELSCTDNCSGNGICINGTCDCYSDFYGESCILKTNIAPEILSGGITCPNDQKSCKAFVISGINFLDVSLTCLVRPIKVYYDRLEIDGSQQSFPARYLNDFSCICTIPDSIRRRRSGR